jgi:hypothetical protein
MRKNVLCVLGLIMAMICNIALANNAAVCSEQDSAYLRQLLKETWAYLDRHLAKLLHPLAALK